ncbi:Permease, cytosine/purines, uracil, thiamine, allantoin [Niveomyces insectorum RCEF 264]|uniref:Permease, cytosine/purines, uracil, thiamine, allantoin n=1 Tax=Niveomyces insectorum RCEF 264 TaxID=1081102 RepID=A0A167MPJ4_9HYPO|nr:Permease, cytosine/purines, uracil, thiamine, allantoin [Niveomyces insectorum RCEF 264]
MGYFRRLQRAVELHQGDNDIPVDRWQNRDLVPLPPSRRRWTDFDFVGLWSTVFLTIYGWQATSALLSYGLSVWQAVVCTIIARVLQYFIVLTLGWVGGVWHISYTVQSRYTFGIWGSMLPIIVRVGVTCVWYGIQSFTGGLLVSALLSTIFSGYQHMHNTLPASAMMTTKQFVGFVLYNILAIPLLYLPPDRLRTPLKVALVASAISIFGLAIGLMAAAHGAGNYIKTPTSVSAGSDLGWAFVHGITTLLGGNAVGMTSQTDFSRFARRPRNQIWGQAFGVLCFGLIVPVFGVLGTSAAGQLYGDVTELGLWNPPNIVQLWLDTQYHNPALRAAAFFTSVGLLLNILALNSVENGVSGGMDFAGLWPRYINIRRGSYLIAIVSVALNPWYLISKAAAFTSTLIILGPIMGVFTADYYVVRRHKVKLSDLYHDSPKGIYWFTYGVNFRAYAAWLLGCAPSLGGMASVVPTNTIPLGLTQTFYTGFITGYAISFLVHWGLNVVFPPAGLGQVDSYDSFGTFSPEEAEKLGIEPNLGGEGQNYRPGEGDVDPEKEAAVHEAAF